MFWKESRESVSFVSPPFAFAPLLKHNQSKAPPTPWGSWVDATSKILIPSQPAGNLVVTIGCHKVCDTAPFFLKGSKAVLHPGVVYQKWAETTVGTCWSPQYFRSRDQDRKVSLSYVRSSLNKTKSNQRTAYTQPGVGTKAKSPYQPAWSCNPRSQPVSFGFSGEPSGFCFFLKKIYFKLLYVYV